MPSVSLDDVLITSELRKRGQRRAHLDRAASALRELAQQVEKRPSDVLPRLVELAREHCGAGSAGISVYEPRPDSAGIFRWNSLTGRAAPFSGETTPRDFSPCGMCLDLVVRLSATEMTRVLNEEPSFSGFFITHLLSRNLRIEEDLVDQLFNSSEKRLARMLLLLSNYGKEGKPIPVIPDITQEMLAEMIGTTRSRVSFFMNKFRKLGFISYNGTLEVHSSLLNVVLYD